MSKLRIPKRAIRDSLLGTVSALLLVSYTLAASSANYVIPWSQIGASGGEGRVSTNYRLDGTIGMGADGVSTSQGYIARLGYVPVQGAILTSTPTETPGGPTDTPRPTNTPHPSETPGGPTDTPTITPAPTNTPQPTETPGGPTDTSIATDTPVLSPTPAPTNTPGVPPTATPKNGPSPTPTLCPAPFTDIAGNIFAGAIINLYCAGVVNGTDATHYSPAGTSTRGQFAKVVVLGFALPSYTPSGGGQDFTDVPPSYFAYTFIETGFHNGILSGFDPAGCTAHGATYPCYLPNIPITRGQLTKLVVGAAHYPLFTPTGGNPTFTDVPANNIFFAFIETAHNKGVINGYPDQTFRPNNNIRRDEMAQIVYKGVTTP